VTLERLRFWKLVNWLKFVDSTPTKLLTTSVEPVGALFGKAKAISVVPETSVLIDAWTSSVGSVASKAVLISLTS
jgi:hypothetical protein